MQKWVGGTTVRTHWQAWSCAQCPKSQGELVANSLLPLQIVCTSMVSK